MRNLFLLLLIFLGAFFLRLYILQYVPVGFHEDEAQIGYNAYSILETGSDKNGNFLPLAVDQFGDFRPAGYHYLTIPSIFIFGLNEFSVRFPAALFGSLLVVAIFFLTKILFNNEKLALISSLTIAVIPWSVIASRATSESIVSLFFVVLGAFFLLGFVKNRNVRFLILSAVLFLVSYFFYHSARFFVPLLVFSVTPVLFYLEKFSKREKLLLITFDLALILGSIGIILFSQGSQRPAAISIFSTAETKLVMEEQIREDGGQNILITRAFHNKLVNYSFTFAQNYFQHFSGEFLFMKGGLPARYIVPNTGVSFPILAPFFLIGLAFLLVESLKEKKFSSIFILLILFLGPVPSALTWEDIPNVQRSIMMLPGLVIVISYGIIKTVSLIKRRNQRNSFIVLLTALFIYSFAFFAHNYFSHSKVHRPWERSVGEKQLVYFLKDFVGGKRRIILTKAHANQPIFFLFYLKVPPQDYQGDQLKKDDRNNIVYKNFTFVDSDCPLPESSVGEKSALYVNRGECNTPSFAKEIFRIYRTDGTIAFKIVELKSPGSI